MKNVLTIAGSDSCGGAGIQADLKTFAAHGVYGMSVITAVTAQNTQGVLAVQDIDAEVIARQIEAVFTDIEVSAVKIGMVSLSRSIAAIAGKLKQYRAQNIVVDPVMISKSGYDLLKPKAKTALIKNLLPLALIVTPNLFEAEAITGTAVKTLEDMKETAVMIHKMGPKNVLIKGGHLQEEAVDVLFDGCDFKYFTGPRIYTKNTHGTGCTLSSAIAANIARGLSLEEAVSKAKEYITTAIEHALSIGSGPGPVNHFYELYKKTGLG
ncbi:MAG: bifunctional hydroxymethylpyrimidine kinase/phosphomethylpyrimidine kinase [Peptococcaceae bacterium]|nr:bifunctional hydroxymethylpyrimidine kinase/phosphomethylpyrimidine kinase [Peptococcaceae bacterium]MDH7525218.1 bifunctional hydroxymethylpyrimidine kinase/phosphomethylpyrimidine kinase [Peptococcaceae bacterium]